MFYLTSTDILKDEITSLFQIYFETSDFMSYESDILTCNDLIRMEHRSANLAMDLANSTLTMETKLDGLLVSLNPSVDSPFEYNNKYNYAQAIFAYPLFNQKCETITDWFRGEVDIRTVWLRMLRQLEQRIYHGFYEEYAKIGYLDCIEYMCGHKNAVERALVDGQVFILLRSSNVEIDDAPVKPTFKESLLCIRPSNSGVRLMHEDDEKKRRDRDAWIQGDRRHYESNKELFKTF